MWEKITFGPVGATKSKRKAIKAGTTTWSMKTNHNVIQKTAGELVVKAQHLWSIKENTNWYWEQQPLQYTIMVLTFTTLRPHIDVVGIINVQDIPKLFRNRIKVKKDIKRHLIFLKDGDHDYILDEI